MELNMENKFFCKVWNKTDDEYLNPRDFYIGFDGKIYLPHNGNMLSVQECVILRYTENTDKDGVDLYDADLVEVEDYNDMTNEYYKIVDRICSCLGQFQILGKALRDYTSTKKVGNAFENPEMDYYTKKLYKYEEK
jgi:hypothetical protein